MTERSGNVAQGETEGPEQEPRMVGDADPAVRDPRPDGPMDQEGDASREEMGVTDEEASPTRSGRAAFSLPSGRREIPA